MAIKWTTDFPKEAKRPSGSRVGRGRPVTRTGAVPGEIRHSVDAAVRSLELVGLLGEVPAGEATLGFRGAIERRHETVTQRTYRAVLRFPGLVPVTQRVEVDVLSYAPGVGALALRSAEPLSRRVGAARYAAAAAAALAGIESLLGAPVAPAAVGADETTRDRVLPDAAGSTGDDATDERAA